MADYLEADGWMPGVEHLETDDRGYEDVPDGTMYPLLVVNHVMQGYLATMVQWRNDNVRQGSANFGIDRNGRIVQFASIWSPTWHAGIVNSPLNPIVKARGGNPNKYSIGIEWEGFSEDPRVYGYDYLYGDGKDAKGKDRRPWPEAQIAAGIRIHEWVFYMCQNWMKPGEHTITEHAAIDQRDRPNDPGAYWFHTVKPRILAAFAVTTPQVEPAPPPAPTPDIDAAIAHLDAAKAALRR